MTNAGEAGRQSSGFLREKALRSEEKDSGMKYLIMEDFAGQPVSFVFPRRVGPRRHAANSSPTGRVLGAGYVELRDGAFRCHGGYAELDIVARPEDEAILMEAFQKAE